MGKLKRADIDTLIMFLILVVISSASVITDSNYSIMLVTIVLFLLVKKDRVIRPSILVILGIIVAINLSTMVVFSTKLELLRVINFICSPILLSYFTVLYFGVSFWRKFENLVYFLTILSLIIYPLDLLFPSVFNGLAVVFKYLTSEKFAGLEYYWSSLVYVHNANAVEIVGFRNSGFMWESGAFAFILVVCIAVNWLVNGVKFTNKRFVIYSIALLTTASTAGYLAYLALLAGAIFNERRNILVYISLIPLTFLIIYIYNTSTFLGEKILAYYGSVEVDYVDFITEEFNAPKLNRFMYMKYQFIEVMKYPWGFGIFNSTDIKSIWNYVGVGGVADMIFMYGIPLFIVIQWYILKFFKVIGKGKIKPLTIGSYIALLIMMFSNPISRNIIVYIILFTPIIISYKTFNLYEHLCNLNLSISRRISPHKQN